MNEIHHLTTSLHDGIQLILLQPPFSFARHCKQEPLSLPPLLHLPQRSRFYSTGPSIAVLRRHVLREEELVRSPDEGVSSEASAAPLAVGPHWLPGVALRAPKTKGHSTEEVRCPPESPNKRKSLFETQWVV
jgi:hypothetical protein